MKFFVPSASAIVLLLAACSTPEEKESRHQRQLAEEARLNFLALKAREHHLPSQVATTKAPARNKPLKPSITAAPVKSIAVVKPAPKPTPKPKPVVVAKPVTPVKPVAVVKPAKPVATAKSQTIARTEKPRGPSDTVYIWDVAHQPGANSAQYSAAEVRYARKIGKKPSQLTPAERQWAREHS